MTTREKAHKLLDAVPESELEPIVEILTARSESGCAEDARRAREFLISAADGNSGLDLQRLRSVRDRAWR